MELIDIERKLCSYCGLHKPLTQFSPNIARGKIRPHSQCKKCRSTKTLQRQYEHKKNNIDKVADRTITQKCTMCGEVKYQTEFHKKSHSVDGFSKQCRTCENPKKRSLIFNWWLKQYGLTLELYNEMFTRQKGVCAICQQPETRNKTTRLSVDHDHLTGRIRGLLCHKCNVVLGLVDDNKETLIALINYLK